ncbi:hypothetical protein [Streptomyces buecherae]|uniref:Uncharacterized protein n=1 Tax=Streptomyces buecherae TaxID=2763006 RepID=A0A7H8NB77_9ACTN|nr:hypothetical protein [Streptomyces buecherae]QKW51681.1 hypothetical protein HUT08_21560 [Streptomyces buecherae]
MATIPLDLLDRIRALERQVRELTGRAQMRPPLNTVTSGAVTIGGGGILQVQQPTGAVVFHVGQSGAGDWGILMQREDDRPAFSVGGGRDALSAQTVRLWARSGRVLVMDDPYSPRFLGRPYTSVPLYPTAAQASTSSTYGFAWVGGGPAHNPVAVLQTATWAGAGGGQVRITMTPEGGTATKVAEYDVPASSWLTKTITQPLHGCDYLTHVHWQIEHRAKTAGQSVETRVFSSYTRQCASAAEEPSPPPGAAAARTAAAPQPPLPPPDPAPPTAGLDRPPA